MFVYARRGFVCLSLQNDSFLCKSRILFSLYLSTCNDRLRPHPSSQSASALKDPQKPNPVLLFLKENGFSDVRLEKIVKSSPKLLSSNLDKTIKPKFEVFRGFGFSADETVEIISKDPWVLTRSMGKGVLASLNVMKDLLGSTADVAKHLKICGWYLRIDLVRNFDPNIQLLKSCGITTEQICRLMRCYPRFLLLKPENMKKIVERAEEMGADRNSVMFHRAIRVVGSMSEENFMLKIEAFRKLGFSQDDILRAFRTQPHVFNVSEEKLKKVKEVILATGKYNMTCLTRNPVSVGRSIEKRYKPRLQVLGILEKKRLIKKWPGFGRLGGMTDTKFYEKFIGPYLNEIDVCMAKGACNGKREVGTEQISTGLPAKEHAKAL